MVNHLHCDAAVLGLVEGAGGVAVEGGPGFFVDLGFQGGFEGFVGIVCAEEVGFLVSEGSDVLVGCFLVMVTPVCSYVSLCTPCSMKISLGPFVPFMTPFLKR